MDGFSQSRLQVTGLTFTRVFLLIMANKLEMLVEKRLFVMMQGAIVFIQHPDSIPGLAATDEPLIEFCYRHVLGDGFRRNRAQKNGCVWKKKPSNGQMD